MANISKSLRKQLKGALGSKPSKNVKRDLKKRLNGSQGTTFTWNYDVNDLVTFKPTGKIHMIIEKVDHEFRHRSRSETCYYRLFPTPPGRDNAIAGSNLEII